MYHDGFDRCTSNAVPLFELRLGISNHSNALACASKCGKRIEPKLRDKQDLSRHAITGIPQQLVERAQEVLDCTKRGLPIPSRQRSTGPSPEQQLAVFFASISDWQCAGDDIIAKFLAMVRMSNQ